MKSLKSLVLLVAALFVSTAVFAQFAIGPKLGVAVATISSDGDFDYKSRTNLQIGLAMNIGNTISVQPELTYLGRGSKLNILGGEITSSVAYIDLGALLKVNFGQEEGFGGYLGAGPFFGYAISGTTDDGSGDVDIDFDRDGYNRTDFALAGALGLTYKAGLIWFADLRYILGLSDLSDNDVVNLNFNDRNRTLGFTVGVLAPF